jgi:hypothetical protein
VLDLRISPRGRLEREIELIEKARPETDLCTWREPGNIFYATRTISKFALTIPAYARAAVTARDPSRYRHEVFRHRHAWLGLVGLIGACASSAAHDDGAAMDAAAAGSAARAAGSGGRAPASAGAGAGGTKGAGMSNGGMHGGSGGAHAAGAGGAGGTGGDDNAGASGTGGAAACVMREISLDDSATGTGMDQFDYQGAWSTSSAPEKWAGDDHYTDAADASATLRFEGERAALHAATASHHGIALVSVDGAAPSEVDLYSATRADDVEVWHSEALASGAHVLVVRASGRKNASSSGTTIAVDRVVVTRPDCAEANGSGSGGAGAGGTGGSGGQTGTAGQGGNSGGTVARPSYNTGSGFFVVGNKLYDANGVEFRIRGLNKLHWDSDSPGISKTHANTVRWDIDFSQSAATNLGLMQQSIADHIVPMPGNWQGTCDESTATLTSMVDTWVAQASTWKTLEGSMILNIANEWGPSSSVWRDAYITAIGRLREAGYLCTISVTSGGCGQSNDDLVNYAQAVFDSDPQKNVIFDQHIYGNWSADGQSGATSLSAGLDALAATGLPMIVGEFGPGRDIGPSPTDLTPAEIMAACEARGIGWLAWAWDDPPSNADDTWFALSKNGDYDSSADLTMFGKVVVEDPSYGLLVLAQPATIF